MQNTLDRGCCREAKPPQAPGVTEAELVGPSEGLVSLSGTAASPGVSSGGVPPAQLLLSATRPTKAWEKPGSERLELRQMLDKGQMHLPLEQYWGAQLCC